MTPEQRWAVQRDRLIRARLWLIPNCLLWVLIGAGTLVGYAGHPEDAPHLHIPQDIRGWAWILTGVFALYGLVSDHEVTERATRLAAALLLIMPLMRAVSYSWAWWVWFMGEDGGHFAHWYQEGSPSAWYSCTPWWAISSAILSQAVNWRRVWRHVQRFARRGGHA